jgi:hypothetical protein
MDHKRLIDKSPVASSQDSKESSTTAAIFVTDIHTRGAVVAPAIGVFHAKSFIANVSAGTVIAPTIATAGSVTSSIENVVAAGDIIAPVFGGAVFAVSAEQRSAFAALGVSLP